MSKIKTDNSLWQNPSFPFRAWYYYIPWFFRTLKFCIQRARRGFSDYDVWNLDSYLAILIKESLVHLADTAHGYPNNTDDMESWKRTLINTAEYFHKYYEEEEVDQSNDAYIRYLQLKQELLKEHPNAEESDLLMISPALVTLRDFWLREYDKVEESKKENLRKGMDKLKLIFPYLWD